MADFYDMVAPRQQQKKRRKRDRILLTILFGALLLAAGVFVLTRLGGYPGRVRDFRSRLNSSTIYAYNHDCLRAEVDGVSVRVTGDHAYDVYQCMSVRSLGGNALFAPRGTPAATLDYGDGSVLRIWPDKDDNGSFIRFDGATGRRCIFHSRDIRVRDLVPRYLTPEKNALWE